MCCTQYYRRPPARLARQTSISLSISLSHLSHTIVSGCSIEYRKDVLYPVLQAAARKAGQADLYLSLYLSLSIYLTPLFLAVALSIARMCCTQYYRRPPARLARLTSISISQPPLFLAIALSIARMCCTQYYRRPPASQARQTSLSLYLSHSHHCFWL